MDTLSARTEDAESTPCVTPRFRCKDLIEYVSRRKYGVCSLVAGCVCRHQRESYISPIPLLIVSIHNRRRGGYTGGFNAVITIFARTQPAPAAKMIPFPRAFKELAATTDEMTATVKST